MEKLKVGQRIELFEILTKGFYRSDRFIIGTIRPAIAVIDDYAEIYPETKFNGGSTMVMVIPDEVRPIGAMIVKKLHGKKTIKLQQPLQFISG